jgi:hypothetical protein
VSRLTDKEKLVLVGDVEPNPALAAHLRASQYRNQQLKAALAALQQQQQQATLQKAASLVPQQGQGQSAQSGQTSTDGSSSNTTSTDGTTSSASTDSSTQSTDSAVVGAAILGCLVGVSGGYEILGAPVRAISRVVSPVLPTVKKVTDPVTSMIKRSQPAPVAVHPVARAQQLHNAARVAVRTANHTGNPVDLKKAHDAASAATKAVADATKPKTLTDAQKKALEAAKKGTKKADDAQKKAQDAQKQAAKTRANAAAAHLQQTASKLSRFNSAMAGKLRNAGTKLQQQAAAIKGDVLGGIIGHAFSLIGDAAPTTDPTAAITSATSGSEIEAQIGDIATQVYNVLSQVQAAGQQSLFDAGNQLITRANNIIDAIEATKNAHRAM